MRRRHRQALLLPLAGLLFIRTVAGAAAKGKSRECFNIDGSVSTFSWPCDNSTTGHTTCCQPGATCYSNGVCLYMNVGDTLDYQRVGCTDQTWADPACLKRCDKYAPNKSAGIRPCDGITQGNHYCCDDGSQGIGSFHCCQNSTEMFVMGNTIPAVAAVMPLSDTQTADTDSSPSGTNQPAAITTMASGSGSGSDGSGKNNTAIGVGVGLGVGIPLAAAIACGIFYLVWRAKRRQAQPVGSSHYYGGPYRATTSSSGGGGGGMAQHSPRSGQWGFSPYSESSQSPGETPKYAGGVNRNWLGTAQSMNRGLPPGELSAYTQRTELPS